ncbi:unnamed protein product [Caenorhabditis angaria]|uniref:Uncharacterized protein n=1 Tax=Caenorhabditis angaria TaxID=860376 RepID=A0A9P1N6T3_9PELO|nr:unnamed protein product [Caenorhabditis angaria]
MAKCSMSCCDPFFSPSQPLQPISIHIFHQKVNGLKFMSLFFWFSIRAYLRPKISPTSKKRIEFPQQHKSGHRIFNLLIIQIFARRSRIVLLSKQL